MTSEGVKCIVEHIKENDKRNYTDRRKVCRLSQ